MLILFDAKAFEKRTGKKCERFSFKDVSNGCYSERRFDLIVSSFALHLASKSMLWSMLSQLSRISPRLLVLTPHKRPHIETNMVNSFMTYLMLALAQYSESC